MGASVGGCVAVCRCLCVCVCVCVCVWKAVFQEIVVLVNETKGICVQYEAGERVWPADGQSLNTGQLSRLATGHSDRTAVFVIGHIHTHTPCTPMHTQVHTNTHLTMHMQNLHCIFTYTFTLRIQ